MCLGQILENCFAENKYVGFSGFCFFVGGSWVLPRRSYRRGGCLYNRIDINVCVSYLEDFMVRKKKVKPRTTLATAPNEGFTTITFKTSWKIWKQLKIDSMNNRRSMARQLSWILSDVYKYPIHLKPEAMEYEDEE